MKLEEAILYLEHTSKEDFNLEEHQKQNRYVAIQVVLEEIERLNKELQDTKEHLGEYLYEQEEENKKLKKLIIALWHNNSARILNKEQIDLLNNIVFGNDEEDLGSDKE